MGLRLRWLAAAVAVCVLAAAPAVHAKYDGVTSAKALKYLDVLRKRPEPGYLYDRFYNTWLDEATVEDLQKFLVAQAAESKATGDQLLLAFFYAKQGDDVAALEQFRKALADNPASAETWFQKAAVEARTLDFDTAIADLRKARELKPEAKLRVQIDKQLGRLLTRNRQTDEALKVWNELLAANPKDEELAEDLIELHIDEGLFDQAAKLEESLLDRTKDPYLTVTRRLRLGDIYQRGGNREKALEAYSTALNDVGQGSWLEQEILAQTEQVFRREDNISQLKDHYAKLLAASPKRIALHRRMAKLLVELGEQDAAVAAFKKILELTPGDRANREGYIEILAKVGKKDQAIEELKALCEQNPKDAELRFRRAMLLQEAGKTDDAAAEIGKYLAASDKSEYAYLRAGRALEKFDRKPAAADVYRDMAAAFKDSASAQEAYAGFLYSNGKKDEALAIWRKLADGATLSDVLHVARALSAREEHQAAIDILKAREKDFGKEQLFYNQLAGTALAMKKPELAVPWARRRVELAENTSDLEAALDQAVAACDRSDEREATIKELAALPKRSLQQTCLLAELQEAAGDSTAADKILGDAAKSGSLLALNEQIRLFNQRRDWTAAANATRKLLELPGGRKSINVRRLVELCQRDYQLDEALKWVAEWKRLSPGSTTPWTTEAQLLRLQGKEKDALGMLKSAVQKFDEDEDLRVRLAQAYAETDHLGDAERIYWQLYDDTEETGGKLRWAAELAKLAEQQGKTAQLVENLEARRQSNRQSIVPLLALSEVYRVADNYEGRRQALTAAAKIKPDDLELLNQIARVEEQSGDWKAAVATLERAAKLDKTNRTRERIAQLHLNYGNADDGYAILFELAGSGPGDPRTLEAIADAMCGQLEWERAADFLAQRIADHAADYRLRYLLAVAEEEANRTGEATTQFLQLLDNQEELPDVAKKARTSLMTNSRQDEMAQIAPPQVAEVMNLTQRRYMAYQHQQRGQTMRMYVSVGQGGGAASHVSMPSKVEDVRGLAVAHLATMAKQLDEDDVKKLVRSMKGHGIQSADLIVRMDLDRGYTTSQLPELLEKDPDDETALGLVVLNQFGRSQPELAPWSGKAVEKFRKSYPELAMLAALQAGLAEEAEKADDKEHKNKWLDDALAIAAGIDKPNAMTVMATAVSLSGQPYQEQPSSMQQEYRKKFGAVLTKWYPSVQQSPSYGQYAFIYVVGALRIAADPTAYFAFLEDEVARWRGGAHGAKSQQSMVRMYGGQREQLLEPILLPPKELSDFPSTVLVMVQRNDGQDPFASYFSQFGSDGEIDVEKAKTLIEKVRDPVLRLLLANRFEIKELADKALATLMAAEQPQLDVYLLAAGKAMNEERPAFAAELLNKARYLPMNRELRSRVDGAIVAAAQAAKSADASKVSKNVLEAGKAACLRLRQSRLDANKRSELIAAMEDLGLKKEAAKLDQLASSQGAGTTGGAAVIYSGGYTLRSASSAAAKDRVAQLIAEGKRDEAVKLLVTEVLAQARPLLSSPQNIGYSHYQLRQIKQRVMALGMVKPLLEAVKPTKSDDSRKLAEYGMVCEMFEKLDDARKAYEQVLGKKPKDDAVRIRLVMLLKPADSQAIEEHFKKLGGPMSAVVGQCFQQRMQDYELSMEERIENAALATKYLRTLAGDKNAQPSWADSLVQALATRMYSRNGSGLPPMYNIADEREKKSEQQAPLLDRRRVVHRELCEAMLAMPETAPQGFTHLLAAAESDGKAGDEFVALAAKVLRDQAEKKSRFFQSQTHYSSDESNVRMQSPQEFLVRQAVKTGDWKLIDEDLKPALEKARDKSPGRMLDQMAKLYRCSPKEFLTAAEQVLKQPAARLSGMPDPGAELDVVLSAWADRKLAVDLQPLMLEQLKRLAKSQNHYRTPAALPTYFEEVRRQQGAANALALLEEVATVYLGPKEKRADAFKKFNTRQGWSYGTPMGNAYVFGQFLSELVRRPGYLTLVGVLAQDLPPSDQITGNVEGMARNRLAKMAALPSDKLLGELAGSPWLADLDTFDPILVRSRNGQTQPWLTVLLQGVNGKADKKKAFAEALAKTKAEKPTFGVGLMGAYFRGEEALLEFVAGRLDDVRKIEKERQTRIATLVENLAGKNQLAKTDLKDSLKPVKEWIDGAHGNQSQQLLENVRKAKRLEELVGDNSYEAANMMHNTVEGLIDSNPGAVHEIFFRYVELAADAQKRDAWNMNVGEGGTAAGYLLTVLVPRNDQLTLAALPLLTDIIANEKNVLIEYAQSNGLGVTDTLNRAFDEMVRERGGKKVAPADGLKQLVEKVAAQLDGRPPEMSSLFIDAWYDLLNNRFGDEKEFTKAAEWAKDQATGDKAVGVAADLYAAIELRQAAKEIADNAKRSTGETAAAGDQFYHQHFQRLLQSDRLPLTWRMHLAKVLVDHDGTRVPEDLGLDVLKVYNAALDPSVPLTTSQQRSVMNWMDRAALGEAFKQPLAEWQDNWAKRFLRVVPPRPTARYVPVELNNEELLLSALEIYLRQGDAEHAAALVKRYPTLNGNPAVIVLLLRAKQPDEAAKFVRAHWSELSLDWPSRDGLHYDDALKSHETALIEKLTRTEEKFFARTLLASLPDAKAKGETGHGEDQPPDAEPKDSARGARMAALAEEFKKTEFKDEAFKIRTLALLGHSPKAGAILEAAIAEQFKKINLALAYQQNDDRQWNLQSELAARHFANQFRRGDPSAFVETFDKLVSMSADENNYSTGQKMGTLITCCLDSMKSDPKAWTPEQCAAVGKSLAGLLTGKDSLYLNNQLTYNSAVFLAYVRSGKLDELKTWHKALTVNSKRWIKSRGLGPHGWKTLAGLFGEPAAENREQRLTAVSDAIAAASELEWLNFHDNGPYSLTGFNREPIYKKVIESGLVTRDELLEYGRRQPAPKRQFLANITLAEWLAANKQHKAAARLYAEGVARAPKSWIKRTAHWKMNAGFALVETGNLVAARGLYEEVQAVKTLGDAGKGKLAKLGKAIDQKADKKTEDGKKPADKPAEAGGKGDVKKRGKQKQKQALLKVNLQLREAGAAIVQFAAI